MFVQFIWKIIECFQLLDFRMNQPEGNICNIFDAIYSLIYFSIKLNIRGKEIPLVDYFMNEYRIHLRYPDRPCVVEGDDKSYHPIELLRIPENQRVPKIKQSNDLVIFISSLIRILVLNSNLISEFKNHS